MREKLRLDVVPSSSSKRFHLTGVALRGLTDREVRMQRGIRVSDMTWFWSLLEIAWSIVCCTWLILHHTARAWCKT